MNGFVSISLAPGAPGCVTERGTIRPGESLVVPVEMAADLVSRAPDEWVVALPADLAEVKAEIKRRAAPPIPPAARADEEN